MKRIHLFLILVVLSVVVLVACNKSDTDEPSYPGPSVDSPEPGEESYPKPEMEVQDDQAFMYPEIEDGGEVDWWQARTIFLNGAVVKVVQAESGKLMITLNDGRTLITYEPVEGDLTQLLEVCEVCKDIEVVKE